MHFASICTKVVVAVLGRVSARQSEFVKDHLS
jgi:hypothetical protein